MAKKSSKTKPVTRAKKTPATSDEAKMATLQAAMEVDQVRARDAADIDLIQRNQALTEEVQSLGFRLNTSNEKLSYMAVEIRSRDEMIKSLREQLATGADDPKLKAIRDLTNYAKAAKLEYVKTAEIEIKLHPSAMMPERNPVQLKDDDMEALEEKVRERLKKDFERRMFLSAP